MLKFNTKIMKYLPSNTSCCIVCEATCFGPYMTIIRSSCLRNTYLGMNKTGNVTWRSFRLTLVAAENNRSITYSECVSVALIIQHAMRMRRTMSSSVACLTLHHFSEFSHKRYDLPEKKLLNPKSVFWFSLQLLFETFLFLRRTERDILS